MHACMGTDIHTYTEEYYSAIKNAVLSFLTTWIPHKSIIYFKCSMSKKVTIWSLWYVDSKKQTSKTKMHRYAEQIDGCQSSQWGMGEIGQGWKKDSYSNFKLFL